MMAIKRDLTDGFTLWAQNDAYDFYVKKWANTWYAVAVFKGTDLEDTKAGFTTRKAARHCCEVWSGWMKQSNPHEKNLKKLLTNQSKKLIIKTR